MGEAVDESWGWEPVDSMDCSYVIVQASQAQRAMSSSSLAPWQTTGELLDSAGQSFGIVLES